MEIISLIISNYPRYMFRVRELDQPNCGVTKLKETSMILFVLYFQPPVPISKRPPRIGIALVFSMPQANEENGENSRYK